ncbi:hypothetical protein [Legionella bononiensis]|uniref:Uncharacterized protein n=1 Tax=Legionella bononiensis TaxID=2793102 RepID=A0ABS1WA78_9GAMM|nr:hypothetical protein [Legionella bononiensis]MBL7480505.1 hypothetical protein [Legionella bononiensis]MBL7526255.1 hypothetical protein [Legionella bononiensis]MBL7563249.1 hypothetical protein [Legionella bononiensis]
MPSNFNKYSFEECTQAIEAFLDYSETQEVDKLVSLSDLILYYMKHKHPNTLLGESTAGSVIAVKYMCSCKDQRTRSNFLHALTAKCYQYAPHEPIDKILFNDSFPAKIVATFHHETITKPNDPIRFTADLDTISHLTIDKQTVLLFCTRVFAPEVTIFGNFVTGFSHHANLEELKKIVEVLPSNTTLTYVKNELGRMKSKEMTVFLNSVNKASQLVLDNARLDQWSEEHWSAFVKKVEQNPTLTSLSLNKTSLHACCHNPKKFQCILKLLALPHLKELFLHNNLLGKLPVELFEELRKAIQESPIAHIGLRHIPHDHKGAASVNGMFAHSAHSKERTVDSKNQLEASLQPTGEHSAIAEQICRI